MLLGLPFTAAEIHSVVAFAKTFAISRAVWERSRAAGPTTDKCHLPQLLEASFKQNPS